MMRVKLIKARSYSGAVRATKAQPYVDVKTSKHSCSYWLF